jgi:hypothetical protein
VLKTATSYSARQIVSNQQEGSSSKPASEAGGGDVVAEKDSTAGRDSSYHMISITSIGLQLEEEVL